MKRVISLVLLVLSFCIAYAQSASGDWASQLAYRNNSFNVPMGEEVYSLCEGNLFAYDTKTTEVRLLSKLDGMNGKYVSFMGYSTTQHCLILVYNDGNIDILLRDGTFFNIPQYRNAQIDGITMNSLTVNGDWAVLATSRGIVLIDVARCEIHGVYDLGEKIYAGVVFDGDVLVAREATILACPLTQNLSDQTQWVRQGYVAARAFVPLGDRLYFTVSYFVNPFPVGLWYTMRSGEKRERMWKQVGEKYFPIVFSDGQRALFSDASEVQVYEASSPDAPSATYAMENTWLQLSRTSDGRFWASEGEKGLQAYRVNGGNLVVDDAPIGNYGPAHDLCYNMHYDGNRLLIAGGWLDYSGALHPGTLMQYEDDKWTFFEDNLQPKTGHLYVNMTSIVQDPADDKHHYASSGNTGLYEFRDYKFVRHYTNSNSPLVSAAPDGNPNHVVVDGLTFDNDGNLWMMNNQTDTILRVLKSDGTWKGVYVDDIRWAPTPEKMFFDRKGRLWLGSRRTVSNHTAGVLCLDYNGTIDNDRDDVSRYRMTCVNEDGATIRLNGVYALAEDKNGEIWVGTGDGLFVVENPDEWFDSDFTILQIKVPRNDGTNFADYLLDGIPVSAIAVDGANRKWLGTYGSGLYLVSPDGTEILEHFTEENSPLLSNTINSLAVNSETGILMIGTNVGLCSYESRVTAPETSLKDSNILVYPNPVRPEYSGKVVLRGLTSDADVKVVTTGGQVVAGGTSVGGTFLWDCCDLYGRRVAPGVYYFMISTSTASQGVVAKVVVI